MKHPATVSDNSNFTTPCKARMLSAPRAIQNIFKIKSFAFVSLILYRKQNNDKILSVNKIYCFKYYFTN